LRDFSHFAAQNGYEKATWIAPLQPLILNALAEAAYTAAWDFSLYLYEYRPEAEWAFSI
jgi:hypothetical protein